MSAVVRVGCAGWSLAPAWQASFGAGASHLARYATRLNACEINSSFHRPHRPATYARWAAEAGDALTFSAKLPKWITHERRLADCAAPLAAFMQEVSALGHRLGCLLVQLPPSLAFDGAVAHDFFAELRTHWRGSVALEPRHASWFESDVDDWLAVRGIARVLADPVRHASGRWPGGHPGVVYLRLHGSPRVYHSAYDDTLLQALAQRLRQAVDAADEVWCFFDNTASGAAAGNALRLVQLLGEARA